MPEAHPVGVLLGHPHAGVVGEDPKLVEADLSPRNGSNLDALDDADAGVGVDDLLADLELHTDLSFQRARGCWRACWECTIVSEKPSVTESPDRSKRRPAYARRSATSASTQASTSDSSL